MQRGHKIHGTVLRLAILVLAQAVGGCAAGGPATSAAPTATTMPPTPAVTTAPTATPMPGTCGADTEPPEPQVPDFAEMEPGRYCIDPDANAQTSLRVLYTVPTAGWSRFIGPVKYSDTGWVAVNIIVATSVVKHACEDQSAASPPIGPTVDDLAIALANLAPFEVTLPPTDATIYGFSGKRMQLTVPELPMEMRGEERVFSGCRDGILRSWIGHPLSYAFYGYTGPGHTEEMWILDVEGTRLLIEGNWSPDSTEADLAEMRQVLDSIEIEP